MQPIIRWAGSKRQLLHKIKEFLPARVTRYIEPFCGSACLFFDLEPTAAVLGDLNDELISTYRALRRDPSIVCECLRRLAIGEEAYYRIRAISPAELSEPEAAARFLYLNRYCFNGIYRTNASGVFNVPYGPQKRGGHIDYDQLMERSALLQRATLLSEDFERTLTHAGRGDFVYLDPPYAVANRRVFAEYSARPFSPIDLVRLDERLTELDEKGTFFAISYADCQEARRMFGRWHVRRVRARRHIAGFAGHRRFAFELIATNHLPLN